jgi:molecular chaperone DnaK (HSP70)
MNVDLIAEEQPSRYVVGIDLGTTNSAVCYVDCAEQPWQVRVLPIPQYVAPGQIEARDTLPSFHYQPPPEASGTPAGPVVGYMARDHGAATPGRVIASAKSWLCHTGIDRTANVLPWRAASDVQCISPIDASSHYLAHIRAAWDERFTNDKLVDQDIVLTLPASFDEIARELTVQAAMKAGLPRLVLIEEPQAAFYAWIYKHQSHWERLVSPGSNILVCDIGGGTTDFTLIRVCRGESGKIQFHRVAVGDHLLLGGDNMDVALAKHLESKLVALPAKLDQRQWESLLRLSRQVKEQLLSSEGPHEIAVSLPGAGSKLIGGQLSTTVTREDVQRLLIDGFMPRVALTDRPAARQSGFQEFGLPYAADPAITRYLAAFLTAHRRAGEDESGCSDPTGGTDPARPDVILFNGGVFESPLLQQRLLDVLTTWFGGSDSGWRPFVLDNDRLDLAVARGAAYYGMARRGEGVKIVASLARTYYVGIESQPPAALCLVPGNAEPGQTIELLERQFDLLVSEPVEFPLYTSSIRLTDKPGDLVPIDPEQLTALPPIRTALKTRSRRERGMVPVRLFAKLTEIGTLELWCREAAGERTWRLQFDVRSATQTDATAHAGAAEQQGFVDEEVAAALGTRLRGTFAADGKDDPSTLIKRLVAAAGSDRAEWPTSLLRRIWELLMELERGRRKSPGHEARWLNLLGYSLRPGYGLAVDDWRVAETWKTVQGKLAHGAATSRTESLILWRRIAGGLPAGQQQALAEPLIAATRVLYKKYVARGRVMEAAFSPHESLEMLRLLGALELLPSDAKTDVGRMLVELLGKEKLSSIRPAIGWAIGRLGARELMYGPLNTVLPPSEVSSWIEKLLEMEAKDPIYQFVLVNLARRTSDRFRDIDEMLRERVVDWLRSHAATEHATLLVQQGGQLDSEEQLRVFGESLPKGLSLR